MRVATTAGNLAADLLQMQLRSIDDTTFYCIRWQPEAGFFPAETGNANSGGVHADGWPSAW
jgi:hypothetical protein